MVSYSYLRHGSLTGDYFEIPFLELFPAVVVGGGLFVYRSCPPCIVEKHQVVEMVLHEEDEIAFLHCPNCSFPEGSDDCIIAIKRFFFMDSLGIIEEQEDVVAIVKRFLKGPNARCTVSATNETKETKEAKQLNGANEAKQLNGANEAIKPRKANNGIVFREPKPGEWSDDDSD